MEKVKNKKSFESISGKIKLLFGILVFMQMLALCKCTGSSADLKIDKKEIKVKDGEISEEYVNLTVIHKLNNSSSYRIVFEAKNPNIYVVDADNDEITVIATPPLKGKGAKFTFPFFVYGESGGFYEVKGVIIISLFSQNKLIQRKRLIVKIVE